MEARREAVLRELAEAWDEVEEAEEDRRAALRELEEDCLALYGAKVAQVRHHAACLRAEVDAARAELDALHAAIGHDGPRNAVRDSRSGRSLREELRVIASELEDMRRRRDQRRRELTEVKGLIDRLQLEMRTTERPRVDADGDDLTMKRLQELRTHLRHLQSEKVCSDQSTTMAMCKTKAINLLFFFGRRIESRKWRSSRGPYARHPRFSAWTRQRPRPVCKKPATSATARWGGWSWRRRG
jgi:protein regulator of cytokinesis 1